MKEQTLFPLESVPRRGPIRKKSETYEEFVDKFRPKFTTDDCYTPPAVYEVVLDWVKMIADVRGCDNVILYIEDARKRMWFGNTGRERLKGAGSVCRDAKIWQDWCEEQGIECVMVAPKHNRTKLSASQFRVLTKWTGRTTEHSRDAAMMVFGR